jgi:hypothetical protein
MTSLSKKKRVCHFMMGNGFSMAYDPSIFSYNALQKIVADADDDLLSDLFGIFNTSNFELIMQQLDITMKLANRFEADIQFKENLEKANVRLKESLIQAIKDLHPDHVFEITQKKSLCCGEFVKRFLYTGGELFTTNYDLLMYWVLMRNGITDISDGFGRIVEDTDEYVFDEADLTWGKYKNEQNIHYLHGALPFFDNGVEIIKEVYSDNCNLMESVKMRIDDGEYPVFVTAGDGYDKLRQIKHNSYLTYCYDRLCNITGSLIIFGFNFGEYDLHIIDAINKASKFRNGRDGKLYSIYIGVYSESDYEYIKDIEDKFKCKVQLFDSKTADIWKPIVKKHLQKEK